MYRALIIALICSSCSLFEKSASWHVEKAKKMDPSIFETKVDTVVVDPVGFEIDCDSIMENMGEKDPFVLFLETPIANDSDEDKIDSIRVEIKWKKRGLSASDSAKIRDGYRLTKEDSARIHQKLLDIQVDCPDCINEKEVITLKPSIWDHLKWSLLGLLIGVLITFLMFFRTLTKK